MTQSVITLTMTPKNNLGLNLQFGQRLPSDWTGSKQSAALRTYTVTYGKSQNFPPVHRATSRMQAVSCSEARSCVASAIARSRLQVVKSQTLLLIFNIYGRRKVEKGNRFRCNDTAILLLTFAKEHRRFVAQKRRLVISRPLKRACCRGVSRQTRNTPSLLT